MLREIFGLLRSDRPDDRIRGWTELREDYNGLQSPFEPDEWNLLISLLLDENDSRVLKAGILAMLAYLGPKPNTVAAAPIASESGGELAGSLAGWLWGPFNRKSAVFSLSDINHLRLDELAVIPLVQHLSRSGFLNAPVHFVRANDPQVNRLAFDRQCEALCFVGRMGIFGNETLDRWGNKNGRFSFLMDRRPAGLPPGRLDPEFHCIAEQLDGGEVAYHRTVDSEGMRTDYALVQRYIVNVGSRQIPVIGCAGGSTLGTLAAATWATHDLTTRQSPVDDGLLPMPAGLRFEDRLEALVRVVAPITGSAWQPQQIELCKLYAGRHTWSNDERCWKTRAQVNFTVFADRGEVASLLLDGTEIRLQRGSQRYRLLMAILDQILQRGDNSIDVAALAKNKSLWGGKEVSVKKARNGLSLLKYHVLGDCLVIADQVTMTADVTRVDTGTK